MWMRGEDDARAVAASVLTAELMIRLRLQLEAMQKEKNPRG